MPSGPPGPRDWPPPSGRTALCGPTPSPRNGISPRSHRFGSMLDPPPSAADAAAPRRHTGPPIGGHGVGPADPPVARYRAEAGALIIVVSSGTGPEPPRKEPHPHDHRLLPRAPHLRLAGGAAAGPLHRNRSRREALTPGAADPS